MKTVSPPDVTSGTPSPGPTGGPGTEDPTRFHYPFARLKTLVRLAYDSYIGVVGPAWLDSEVVQVDAVVPPNTNREQFQEMLRNLIAERFSLKYHAETRDAAGYDLVVTKTGVKMKRSVGPETPSDTSIEQTGVTIAAIGARKRLEGRRASMRELTDVLAAVLGSLTTPGVLNVLVTDSTRLNGRYDFNLSFTNRGAAGETGGEEDVFAALPDQLGLKLVPKKQTAQILVVHHMDRKPTEN